MSKNTNKDLELLSAYFDGELSSERVREIENKLASSEEFRKKYEELKKLKYLTTNSFEAIPESPYFESVLNRKIKKIKKRKYYFKASAPIYGLGILTVIILLLLKFNPKILNQPLNHKNTNLTGMYSNNLIPLLSATNLSNEDIFNFAFYKQLPLDNGNKQYLQLGTDETGREYFEIKKDNFKRRKNNLEKFALALRLNEKQKSQVDSIIKVYTDELKEQILVNDKNTLAVSQNLFDYNRALAAELLTFAAKANKNEFKKIMPAGLTVVNNKTASIIIKETRNKKSGSTHRYVFFNVDTVFTKPYKIDKEKLKKEIILFKNRAKKNSKIFKNYSINIKIDSSLAKIKTKKYWNDGKAVFSNSDSFYVKVPVAPNFIIKPPNFKYPNMDSLIIELDKARENFKEFSYSFPKNFPQFKGKFKFNFSDSTEDFDFDIRKFKTDSILRYNFFLLDSLKTKNMYRYKFNDDSIKIFFEKIPKMFKKYKWYNRDDEIKKLKEEMKDLKKELNEMKKKLQHSKKKIKT